MRLVARDADVATGARRATAAAAVGVAGSILLIVLFAGYLSRVIVRPLRRAAGAAGRLAGGDLSARMRETDVDEIGELERSFNVMAGSLEVSQEQLRRSGRGAGRAAARRDARRAGGPARRGVRGGGREVCRCSRPTRRARRFETRGGGHRRARRRRRRTTRVGSRARARGQKRRWRSVLQHRPAGPHRGRRRRLRPDRRGKPAGATSVGRLPDRGRGPPLGRAGRRARAARRSRTDTERAWRNFTELVATAIANADSRPRSRPRVPADRRRRRRRAAAGGARPARRGAAATRPHDHHAQVGPAGARDRTGRHGRTGARGARTRRSRRRWSCASWPTGSCHGPHARRAPAGVETSRRAPRCRSPRGDGPAFTPAVEATAYFVDQRGADQRRQALGRRPRRGPGRGSTTVRCDRGPRRRDRRRQARGRHRPGRPPRSRGRSRRTTAGHEPARRRNRRRRPAARGPTHDRPRTPGGRPRGAAIRHVVRARKLAPSSRWTRASAERVRSCRR